jgi:predicted alpha/beta hydrolase family esterase
MTYVFVAGIGNSGAEHWQSRWYGRADEGVWVEHASWDNPVRDEWVKDLDDALRAIAGPRIVIAHSLGCSLLIEWASQHDCDELAGAFLVSVPDVHGSAFPPEAIGFGAPHYVPLPFETVVVASEDDPYGSLEHCSSVAERIGARLVTVGRKGHINADSALGDWDEGWAVFRDHFAT